MSKAVEWFKTRSQKNKGDKDKSSDKRSPSSRFGLLGKSERKGSGDWKSETDPNSRSNEPANPFRGRLPARSIDFERSERHQYEDWRAQMTSASKSDEFGWPPSGSEVYRDWQDGRASGNDEKQEFTFGDWKRRVEFNSRLSDSEEPALGRRQSSDWESQVSQSGTSTDRNSLEGHEKRPLERRWTTKESEGEKANDKPLERRWTTKDQEGEKANDPKQQQNSFKLKEADVEKFNFLLQNWPKLKSSSSDKRRFETHLMSLFEVETEIIVVGEEPTQERWSLGIVDDGIKALGRAIASRGYPKLKKLSFTQCRLLLESPFATLAKAINTSHLPNLEEITFHCNSYINNQGFLELAKAFKNGGHFSRLTSLILVDNGMKDEGLIALAREAFRSGNLSNLKKLHIGSHDIEKSNYEQFHLEAAREFAKELSSSGHLPQLEDLRFSGCVHWKGVVSVLEALETRTEGAFKSLDLRESHLECEGMRVLLRAFEAPQFSSLQSLELSVETEEMPILLEAFRISNLCALQKIYLSDVRLGEKELLDLAALLEERHLPGLLEFSAGCAENTVASALALVRAYERNNCLVAKLNIDQWPLKELQVEFEKHRTSNMELDELV